MDSVPEFVNAGLMKSTATLLDCICQETEAGQRWAVPGPNGAGKTSLVCAAFGRLSLSKGNATLDSQDLKGIDLAELATRVAPVSKFPALSTYGGQRVPDLVHTTTWGISVRWGEECEAEDEAYRQDLLEAFGISHLAQREFRTLSEGEAQRVLLTRLLMSNPEVLILGEPGTGLDLGARELFLFALEEIMSGMCTPQVVLVTYQMENIPVGITHAAIMAKGRIIAQGPIDRTLTGVNLSCAYELPLNAGCDVGHWWAHSLKRS